MHLRAELSESKSSFEQLEMEIKFREINRRDFAQLKSRHDALFPVKYSDSFFRDSCEGVGLNNCPLFTSIATIRRKFLSRETIEEEGIDRASGRSDSARVSEDEDEDEDEEEIIIGFILAQMLPLSECPELESAIDLQGLESLPIEWDSSRQGQHQEARSSVETALPATAAANSPLNLSLCYILTFGVLPSFQRGGIGSRLIEHCLAYARQFDGHVSLSQTHSKSAQGDLQTDQINLNFSTENPATNPNLISTGTNEWLANKMLCVAVYLHVISYNDRAIRFYESKNFYFFRYLSDFYFIQGEYFSALLFVFLLNGSKISTFQHYFERVR